MPPLPQPVEIDWLTVEKEIVERCNLEYQNVVKQLIIVAKHDLHKAKHPEQIYTNYGGLWSYWIAAELEKHGIVGWESQKSSNFQV